MLCTLTLVPSSGQKQIFTSPRPWKTTGTHANSNNARTGKNMHKAAMPNYALSSHGLVRLAASAPLLNGPSTLALTRALPVSFLGRYCNVSIFPSGFYKSFFVVFHDYGLEKQRCCTIHDSFRPLCQRVVQCFALLASRLDRIYGPPCICYSQSPSASVKAIESLSFRGTYL